MTASIYCFIVAEMPGKTPTLKPDALVTTSVRIPLWMDKLVEHDAADRSTGKSDIFQMALRKWFKLKREDWESK